MDIHIDTSWCPVCSREIMPKRYTIPAPPPPPPPPPAPPSSPSSTNSKVQTDTTHAKITRTKPTNVRTKGGLAHGTGRVKLNGAVKHSNTSNPKAAAAAATTTTTTTTTVAPPPPTQQQQPVRSRTVIDQGPIPLYCSDECKMVDLNCLNGVLTIDYDPARESQFTPAVPHNSFTNLSAVGAAHNEVYSDGGSDSGSWSSDSTKATNISSSIATLAAIYNFPPMPPPPPILEYSDSQSSSSESEHNFDLYQNGIMMAARRIKDALCPQAPPKRSMSAFAAPQAPPRGPIPGWTDGSGAWRSSVYSLAAPQHKAKYLGDEKLPKAYTSTIATPHRSRGVNSTMGDATAPPKNNNSTGSLPVLRPSAVTPARSASFAEDTYSKCPPLSFSRLSDSRMNILPSSLPASSSASAHSNSRRRQEKNILKAGAEGKLLVPDVKLKVSGGSSLNLSTACMSELSSRKGMRSPLYRHGSETTMSEANSQMSSLPMTQRPKPETRSWSYDNLMTYPVMTPVPKIEKRIEKQMVDGQLKEVVVEVELEQPFKKLFLFPGKQSSL